LGAFKRRRRRRTRGALRRRRCRRWLRVQRLRAGLPIVAPGRTEEASRVSSTSATFTTEQLPPIAPLGEPTGAGVSRIARFSRSGIQFIPTSSGLLIEVTEYHTSPVHLSGRDLQQLGLELRGDESQRAVSVAAPWAASIDVRPDRAKRGPALNDRGWQLPAGAQRDGYLLARVRGGLDVFAVTYDAKPIRLTETDLDELELTLSV
jgi:hypothetical protein